MDKIIAQLDTFLRTILPPEQRHASRNIHWKYLNVPDDFTAEERQGIAGLMRVNHCGEVCAQALYMGQAVTAKLPNIAQHMQHTALEEIDHLAWCEKRLRDLQSHPSLLNPIWYIGSWMLGVFAGWCGDHWSLGFVVETERQVGRHLATHLNILPVTDLHSREILEIMMADEAGHADVAAHSGACELPNDIKWLMRVTAKIMTTISYYV